MSEQERRARRLEAAIASVLAEDEGALWPDELRTLRAAATVAQRLAG